MTIDVDYLSPQAIEREANALLASFETKHGKILSLETPLDEIVEFHLGLTCEMADLGHEAILGQIDIEDKIIRINENLDTSAYPNKEGRFNYTLGHEAGHWVLHRSYVEKEITESVPSAQGRNCSFISSSSFKLIRANIGAIMSTMHLSFVKSV